MEATENRPPETSPDQHGYFATPNGWDMHYDELALVGSFELFEREAHDHIARLLSCVELHSSLRILDFGCGFGSISDQLAALGMPVYFWDRSGAMRELVAERVRNYSNVELIDLSDPGNIPQKYFDVIIVTSVIQYMSTGELRFWMNAWRRMIESNGQIIVSDIISPGIRLIDELVDSVRFAARQRILLRSTKRLAREFCRYLRRRKSLELLRLHPCDFAAMALTSDLKVKFLSRNLTFRRNRLSAILRPHMQIAAAPPECPRPSAA